MTTLIDAPSIEISDEQRRQYREQGYFVLESVIPAGQLEMLRRVCAAGIESIHRRMDEAGTDVIDINHRGKRYFVSREFVQHPELREFLFGPLMASICRATLGDRAYLFNEQFVVKAAERGMKFGWHQDSGYVGYPHRDYLSCWCALDDMSVENGTVFMLPYDRAGTRELVGHVKEEGTNDQVGYHGEDPGEPVIVPAGSIAVFSSVCFHRSGTNTTSRMRRSYLAQYSAEPIVRPDNGKLHQLADLVYAD
jgi:ectoine hydroxylase-related dioxygenase (phytanoyl-CoA dioxygenase family)